VHNPHPISSHSLAIACPMQAWQRSVDQTWNIFVLACMLLLLNVLPGLAFASGGNQDTIKGVICNVAMGLSGTTGPIIGTIAVAVLGVGALFGKTSWTLALTTAVGISVLVGANDVAKLLFGADACPQRTTDFDPTALNFALCQVAAALTGSGSKVAAALATCSILVLGFSAFYGRLAWGTAMAIAVGIALMFGAVSIVDTVYGRAPICNIQNNVHYTPNPDNSAEARNRRRQESQARREEQACVRAGGMWLDISGSGDMACAMPPP
jgi:type IV secretory pathway VirB2 component (pilin)